MLSTTTIQPVSARRAATSAKICDVANELFFERDFNSVTMDEIAKVAGIRRSTLYLHFRDKEAILDAIAKTFTAKLRTVIDLLPGPEPTHEQITIWFGEYAKFVSTERAATELMVSLGHMSKTYPAVMAFGDALMHMMAERLSAFKRALEPGESLAFACALSTLDVAGWALCHHARDPDSELSKHRLTVASAALNRFVRGEL